MTGCKECALVSNQEAASGPNPEITCKMCETGYILVETLVT